MRLSLVLRASAAIRHHTTNQSRPYSIHHHCQYRKNYIILSWWGSKVAGGIGSSDAAKVSTKTDVIELLELHWDGGNGSTYGLTTTTTHMQRSARCMCSFKTIKWMRRSLQINFPCNVSIDIRRPIGNDNLHKPFTQLLHLLPPKGPGVC
jgi:hypothetical protein